MTTDALCVASKFCVVKIRMDIEKFLELRPEWTQNPCLYIVRQMATENPGASRCGASGTFLVPNQDDLDLPYRSDSAILKGLLGRMVMYQNYWLPIKGHIFAALRIKRALVAEPQQRCNALEKTRRATPTTSLGAIRP